MMLASESHVAMILYFLKSTTVQEARGPFHLLNGSISMFIDNSKSGKLGSQGAALYGNRGL